MSGGWRAIMPDVKSLIGAARAIPICGGVWDGDAGTAALLLYILLFTRPSLGEG
jgi:hypothetical protein